MRFGSRGPAPLWIAIVAVPALFALACATTPPPASTASPSAPSSADAAAEPAPPAQSEASGGTDSQRPAADFGVPPPPDESIAPVSEIPADPFAEDTGPGSSAPAEKPVLLSDAPLPTIELPGTQPAASVSVESAEKPAPEKSAPPAKTAAPSVKKTEAAPPKTAEKPKTVPAVPPKTVPAEPIVPLPSREPVPVPAAGLPELPSRAVPIVADEKIEFSRTVRATVGQLVEIPFRGAGWVYLGERGARKGLPYDSRRLDADGQSFVFRTEAAGTYALQFQRQDYVNDYIVNDNVQVLIEEAPYTAPAGGFSLPVDRGRVVAEPRWPPASASAASSVSAPAATASAAAIPSSQASALAAADAQKTAVSQSSPAPVVTSAKTGTTGASAAPVSTAAVPAATQPPALVVTSAPAAASSAAPLSLSPVSPKTAPTAAASPSAVSPSAAADSLAPDASAEAILALALTEGDAGRIASALAVLDKFRDRFPSGSDEAWWLYGRYLEANGPNKDVKSAIAYYRRLMAEYPQSSRYDDAKKRVAYLERYFLEIR